MGFEAEHLELAALADLHAAATPELADSLGLRTLEPAGALVSVAGALPSSAIVINRTIGLGLTSSASEDTARAVVAAYGEAKVGRYFVQVHPKARPGALTDWLRAEGLEQARGWQKFQRGRDAVPEAGTDLRVAQIGPEQGEPFGRLVCDAFDLGDAAIPWLARLPGRPGWHIFMSFDGEEAAGAGALFVKDGLAWSDFGATAPKHRRRGSQSALLAQRIRHALELDCRQIFTCTGVQVPGDPQHSYNNILKMGFRDDNEEAKPAGGQRGQHLRRRKRHQTRINFTFFIAASVLLGQIAFSHQHRTRQRRFARQEPREFFFLLLKKNISQHPFPPS